MKHEFLVRPSQLGNLMSKGRTKDKLFGDTAMKVIQDAVLLEKYNIEPEEIFRKEMDKGNFNEVQNIELAKKVLDWHDVDANADKKTRVNDYFIGTPDVNTKTLLADIKTSWGASSFPWFITADTKEEQLKEFKNYYYQLQAYLDLTGKDQAELVFVLSNHPEHIIASEVKRLTYYFADRPHLFKIGGIEDLWTLAEEKATKEVNKQAYVDHIPEKNRVKRYIIKKDADVLKEVYERIDKAREIYDELIKTI